MPSVDTAMGRVPADLVIRNGQWVSVHSGEIIPKTDIAIKDGHIAFVGPDASHTIGKKTQVIDAKGRYLVPGLLDGHMHVESGMVTVTEFLRAVAVRGTIGMFIDPHEIASVFGLRGVKLMVDEAQKQPIHVWVQMPSCVPSAPGLETPGAHIGPKEVATAMKWKGMIEVLFKVKVEKVRTAQYIGKTKRVGKYIGRRSAWKKAYITLSAGDSIDFFEGG